MRLKKDAIFEFDAKHEITTEVKQRKNEKFNALRKIIMVYKEISGLILFCDTNDTYAHTPRNDKRYRLYGYTRGKKPKHCFIYV